MMGKIFLKVGFIRTIQHMFFSIMPIHLDTFLKNLVWKFFLIIHLSMYYLKNRTDKSGFNYCCRFSMILSIMFLISSSDTEISFEPYSFCTNKSVNFLNSELT